MKRSLCILLAAALILSGLSSCGIFKGKEEGAEVIRTSRETDALQNAKRDELALIQYRYDKCIFSGITALSIHGLSDHISESYHVTFPQGYNPSSLKDCGWNLSITRSLPKIYDLGATTVKTEQGCVN